jgi:hypothetical protein
LEEVTEARAELVDDGIQRREDLVPTKILAQEFPQMLDRVQLWTVRWPGQQVHRGRDAQGQRAVHSGSIQQHEAMLFEELRGRVGQEHRPGFGVYPRQDQRTEFPVEWLTAAKP